MKFVTIIFFVVIVSLFSVYTVDSLYGPFAFLDKDVKAATTAAPRTGVSMAVPTVPVLANVSLRDTNTIMQSFAYDDVNKVWIFAQVQQSGRFNKTHAQHSVDGDLTLTKLSKTGAILGYMYLNGFGHGVSIGVEPVGTTTYVWIESVAKNTSQTVGAKNTNGYGTKIARFAWKNATTYTPSSSGVTNYGVNSGAPEQSPAVDYKRNRIAVQYWSTTLNTYRWAVYPLDQFKARGYTPIIRSSWPTELYNYQYDQGWTYINDTKVVSYRGKAYSASNPAPGNTYMTEVDFPGDTGSIANKIFITTGASLSPREPEGMHIIDDNLCIGLTSVVSNIRKANIYCQKAL